MKIAVIGAGWYGVHIAMTLSDKGHDVTLFEKNSNIFMGISGTFGIRIHAGPHYPRSSATRETCYKGLKKFRDKYPELVNEHSLSLYGLGIKDEEGFSSKVSLEEFIKVKQEIQKRDLYCEQVEPEKLGYLKDNLSILLNIEEPSADLGGKLRSKVVKRLESSKVKKRFSTEIVDILRKTEINFEILTKSGEVLDFEKVVNATSYQSLLTKGLVNSKPLGIEVKYQACIALVYIEKVASSDPKPFSFIVMDGWFPCFMPYNDSVEPVLKKYIMTHGSYTILGSFDNPQKAQHILNEFDKDEQCQFDIREACEKSMENFSPGFKKKFGYQGWKGAVLVKVRNDKEFRGAVTFEANEDSVIYVIPGKITNIFDAADEVEKLLQTERHILSEGGCTYVPGGILAKSMGEITERPIECLAGSTRNTCDLQTYQNFTSKSYGSFFGKVPSRVQPEADGIENSQCQETYVPSDFFKPPCNSEKEIVDGGVSLIGQSSVVSPQY